MTRWVLIPFLVAAAGALNGCNNNQEAANEASPDMQPRERGQFSDAGAQGAATQPSLSGNPVDMANMPDDDIHARFRMGGTQPAGTTRPAGTMPSDAIHAGLRPGAEIAPRFTAPAEWQAKPARPMTEQIFVLPRAEGDAEDADLAISYLSKHVTLDMNLVRWCEQFGYRGEECQKQVKQRKLEGTKFPTTIVDISGTYQPGSMMGPAAEPKEGYRMLAAELVAPQKRWYAKLVGPEKTVARWEEAFVKFVKEAK